MGRRAVGALVRGFAGALVMMATVTTVAVGQTLTAPRGNFTISDSARRHVDSVFTEKYFYRDTMMFRCTHACLNRKDHPDSVAGDKRVRTAVSAGCFGTCTGNRWEDSLNFESQLLRDSLVVSVVASGTLRSSLTSSAGNTPAAGALGVTVGEFEHNLTVLVNVAGLTDTLTKNVGSAILPPGAGGLTSGQLSAMIDYRGMVTFHGWGYHGLGYHFYGSVAPAVFKDTTMIASAVIAAIGAQLSWEVYNQAIGSTSVMFLLDAGPTYRGIGGDAGGDGFKTLRNDLLSTTQTSFLGAEGGLTLFVQDVRVGVSTYYFGGHVPGLSHFQAVFGVNVSDAFLSARSSRQHNLGLEGGQRAAVPPPVPTLQAPVASAGQIKLVWDAVAGATSYAVLRAMVSNAEAPPPIATTTSRSYIDTDVSSPEPPVPYYYKLQACNNGTCSASSVEVCVLTVVSGGGAGAVAGGAGVPAGGGTCPKPSSGAGGAGAGAGAPPAAGAGAPPAAGAGALPAAGAGGVAGGGAPAGAAKPVPHR